MSSQQLWLPDKMELVKIPLCIRKGSRAPFIAEEILAVDDYERKESNFSLKVWPLVGCSAPGVAPHSYE